VVAAVDASLHTAFDTALHTTVDTALHTTFNASLHPAIDASVDSGPHHETMTVCTPSTPPSSEPSTPGDSVVDPVTKVEPPVSQFRRHR
jgi:hypothetical protein